MFRSVFAASATAAFVASAKLVGEVPTNSVILYVPGIVFLLGQFGLPVEMHSNPKRSSRETRIVARRMLDSLHCAS